MPQKTKEVMVYFIEWSGRRSKSINHFILNDIKFYGAFLNGQDSTERLSKKGDTFETPNTSDMCVLCNS